MMHSRTRIIGIIAILFFLISFLCLLGIIYVINTRQATVDAHKLSIAERQTYEHELKSLERLVEESKAEREKVSSFILTDDQVIDFLALLESLGREQGASLEATSLHVDAINDRFEELSLTVSVKGSYDMVVHILKELETIPYQSSVSDVSIYYEVEGDDAGLWKGEFNLHVTKYVKL